MSAIPSSSPGIRAVLRSPQVPLLLLASQVGRLPLGAAPLGLLLYARQSLSLSASGLLVAAYTAAMAVSAPLLARGVDRWRQPPILYCSATLSGIGFFVVAFSDGNLGVTLAGAALAGFGTPPLEACLRALWPDLVSPAAVPAAYALDVAAQEVIFVAGPLVALAATAVAGPAAALVTIGLLQLGGVLVFARADRARHWRGVPAARHWAGPLRARRFVVVVLGVVCVGAAVGSIPVVITGYAEAAGNRSIAGWLLAAQAVGALVGGLLYTRARPGGRARLPLLTGAFTVGFLPLLAMPEPTAMAGLLVVSGLALPPVLTAVFLAADRLAPPGTTVEAFAWIFTAFAVGSASGSALNGPFTAAGIRYGFSFAPAVASLAIVATLLACRAPRGPEPDPIWPNDSRDDRGSRPSLG
jgi:predicted MFS family arabinose efflux permease